MSPQDAEKPRAVICKLYKYSVKEAVLKVAGTQASIDFDSAKLALFLDPSRRTLLQQRVVCPVLDALRVVNVPYILGFPFRLSATRNGKSATPRTKDDLIKCIDSLDLPPADFLDWRLPSNIPLPQRL